MEQSEDTAFDTLNPDRKQITPIPGVKREIVIEIAGCKFRLTEQGVRALETVLFQQALTVQGSWPL